MPSLGAMSLLLTADPKPLVSGLGKAASAATNFASGVKATAVAAASALSGMVAGAVSASAQWLGLKTSLGDLANVGVDFERIMSQVAAITGATGETFDALTEKARQLGRDTEFTATQAGEALLALAKGGQSARDSIVSVTAALDLARISGTDLAEAADTIVVGLSSFKRPAEDAARIVDVLAKTAISTSTNVEELAQAFKFAAPIAASTKRPIEDLLSALGVLAKAGIRGSMAGTALRGIMLKMGRPTAEAAEALKDLGISFWDEATGKAKKFAQIVMEVGAKIEDMTDQQQVEFFGQQFEARAGTGFIALKNQGAQAIADFERMLLEDADGTAKTIGQKYIDNVWGSIKIIQSAWEGFAELVFSSVKGPIRAGIDNLTSLVSGLRKGFGAIQQVVQEAFAVEGMDGPKVFAKAWEDVGKSIGPAVADVLKALKPAAQASAQWFAKVMEGGSVIRQFGNILVSTIGWLDDIGQSLWNITKTYDDLILMGKGTEGLESLFGDGSQVLDWLIKLEASIFQLGNAWEMAKLEGELAIEAGLIAPIERAGRFLAAWRDYFIDTWRSIGEASRLAITDPAGAAAKAAEAATRQAPQWDDFAGQSLDEIRLEARIKELGQTMSDGFFFHIDKRQAELAVAGEQQGKGFFEYLKERSDALKATVGSGDGGSGTGGQGRQMAAFEARMASAVLAGSAEAISATNQFRLERGMEGGRSVESQQLEVQKKMLAEIVGGNKNRGAVYTIG